MSTTKIRDLKLSDYKKIEKIFEDFDIPVNCVASFENGKRYSYFPLKIIHESLPIKLKFMQESYVAANNDEILGLISIIPDGDSKYRWKINQLLLEPNSYDVGKLLIDYVISKYGAEGVESFITEVVSTNIDALELFKKGCGFRHCTKSHIYNLKVKGKIPNDTTLPLFKDFSSSDAKDVSELYNDCITTQTRFSLSKNPNDFNFTLYNILSDRIAGVSSKQWVLEEPSSGRPVVFLKIYSKDNKTFYMNCFISNAYLEYYFDVIDFAIRYVGLKNRDANIVVNVIEALEGSKKYIEFLKEKEAEFVQTFEVLVKDYWKPLKDPNKAMTSPLIIFSDVSSSPAFYP